MNLSMQSEIVKKTSAIVQSNVRSLITRNGVFSQRCYKTTHTLLTSLLKQMQMNKINQAHYVYRSRTTISIGRKRLQFFYSYQSLRIWKYFNLCCFECCLFLTKPLPNCFIWGNTVNDTFYRPNDTYIYFLPTLNFQVKILIRRKRKRKSDVIDAVHI